MEDMLMIFLFYSSQPIILKNFLTTSVLVTRIYPFHLNKKNLKISFLDVEISGENEKFVRNLTQTYF